MKKIIQKISLALLITSVFAIMGMFFVNGTFLTKTYLEPWNKNYHTQFDDKRLQIIAHGILAPNAHNKQSWKIKLDSDDSNRFDLFLDEKRLLPETDPAHRQSIMSQGTFLELIDIAAKKLGFNSTIEIFPQGEIDKDGTVKSIIEKPVATIILSKTETHKSNLYNAIFERVTTRTPYLDTPLTIEQIESIKSLNNYEGIEVKFFQNISDLEKIKSMALAGVEIESKNKEKMQESHDMLRFDEYVKNKKRDGLTMDSQGKPKAVQWFMETITTMFPISLEVEGEFWNDGAKNRIPKTPTYVMILSEKDDRTTHVKIGMLYSRIQLAGTSLGLSMQPTMQVTQEYPAMEKLYKEINEEFAKNGQKIQMLFRVGESKKKVKHSPRRDVANFIL